MEVPKNLEYDALDTPNPFVNMSPIEDISLKLQVKADIIKEETEAKLAKKKLSLNKLLKNILKHRKQLMLNLKKQGLFLMSL